MATPQQTALIALDWGTSALRAWRVSETGTVIASRREEWGIMHLPQGGFPAAFASITQDWCAQDGRPSANVPAIACGMVGSRQGWREVPYLATPAGLVQIAGALLPIETGTGGTLHLVPGLLHGDAEAPDVMRGEETQAIGAAAALGDDALLVMPGTHSKWSRLRNQELARFRTMMTGELYALLRRHSILGRDEAEEADPASRDAAFDRGVREAAAHGAFARLFTTRALSLTGRLPAGTAAEYLSGLLIGEELRLGLSDVADGVRIALTGDASLCRRYARAFAALGHAPPDRIEDTALSGLLRIATQAGLLRKTA